MDNSYKMKLLKNILIYSLILIILSSHYDSSTLQYIIFHYTLFDFRYLLFLLFEFYWTYKLFHILYQYLCLFYFMRIRISKWKCCMVLIKRISLHAIIYLLIHVFFFYKNIYLSLLLYNLFIQLIAIVIAYQILKYYDLSYVVLFCFVVIMHLI